MRVILSNRDADRLHAALFVSGEPPTLEFLPPSSAVVCVGGEWFTGKARRTPGDPGSFRVEDIDGRVVLVADVDDDA
jgi:hypothetical protein